MLTLTLFLLLIICWSLWPFARELVAAGDFQPWPYGDEDDGRENVLHKGGGGAPKSPPKQKEQKLPPIPQQQPLPPPPPPPPPPTQDSAEVDQAKADQKRKAARSQGISSTLLAGETGGYQAAQPDGTKKTLLG